MSEDKNLNNEEKKVEEVVSEVTNEPTSEPIVETNETKAPKRGNAKTIIISAVVGILCLGAGFTYGKEQGRKLPATTKNYSSSKVMATVGETKITGADLQKKMDPLFYLNGKEAMTEEQIKAYEASMLDFMTTTEVLYLEAKTKNIKATEEEVKSEYDNLMKSVEQKFALTEEEFLSKFKISKEIIMADLEKEIIATKYMSEATDVSEKEAKSYYDKNKADFLQVEASHILIQTSDAEGNELSKEEKEKRKAKAEEVLAKVKNGEDFATLAKEYSQDGSAEDGGNLGFFGKGQMVESFEKAAYGLKIGETTNELVESKFGYHIIKKTNEKYDEFDTIKEDLIYNLSYEKQNTLVTDLIEKYNVKVEEN